MQHMFSFGLATGKHAMDSGEFLGSPLAWQSPNIPGTPKVEAVFDGPEEPFEPVPVLDRKRKKGCLMEEDISVFSSMTEAVKEVATAIRESKSLNIHPDLYSAVMEQGGLDDEALIAALSHLLDNKAQGVGFVAVADAHRVLSLTSWLDKHYY